MIRKNDPLDFLKIGNVYPSVERSVVSTILDKVLFKTVIILCAHYFIYLELGSGWCSS